MKAFRKTKSTRNYNKGFSLVILAMVVVLVGALAITLIPSPLDRKIASMKNADGNIKQILIALKNYRERTGAYPYPARLDRKAGHAEYGKISADCGAGQVFCTGVVKAGGVPTRDLGLPDKMMYDQWGNRYSYIMTTDESELNVKNIAGTDIKDEDDNKVGIMVISHGPDGAGAYTQAGAVGTSCNRTNSDTGISANATASELGNCNHGTDTAYIFDRWNNTDANFYDDITGIIFKITEASGGSGSPFVAVAHVNSGGKCFRVYNATTTTWQASTVPSCAGSGDGTGVEFNSDFTRLAVSHRGSSPYFNVYEYDEPSNTWSAISTDSAVAPSSPNDIAYSPDAAGLYIAVTKSSSPRLGIIRTDTWTSVAGITNPSGSAEGVEFSPDGKFLAVTQSGAPYISVYDSTNTWAVSAPGTSDDPLGDAKAISFDPVSGKIAVSHVCSSNKCVTIYPNFTQSTANWTSSVNITFPIASTVSRALSYSDDGKYLAIGVDRYLYVIDTTNSNAFVTIDDNELSSTVYETVFDVATYTLSVTHASSPYITQYKYNSGLNRFEKAAAVVDGTNWPGGDGRAITAAEIGGGGASTPASGGGWQINI